MSGTSGGDKGMTVYVLRTPGLGDCSNGGLTARFDRLTLVGPGVPRIFDATEECPAIYYDPRGYRELKLVDPVASALDRLMPPCAYPDPPDEKGRWWMFGGNFIYSSDSRFRDLTIDGGPIPVHDRSEP